MVYGSFASFTLWQEFFPIGHRATVGSGPCAISHKRSSLPYREKEARSRMFTLIGWIFFGVLVGLVARALMPGKDPGGFLVTMGLGIGGSFVGGLVV